VEDVHWWFVARRRIFLSLLDKYLKESPGGPSPILDVGCGTGTMLTYLARYGDAEGIDVDADAIRYCHERGLTRVSQAGADRLPFADGTFGLVTALDVIEHIDDDRAALHEVRRVLRPGGSFLVAVPAYRFLWGRQDDINLHKRRYQARELRERLTTAGFEVLRLSYINAVLFPAIAAVRLARHLLPQPEKVQSDFSFPAPRPLNFLLGHVFGAERFIVNHFDLPFGVSIMALARKPLAN
jgi:SAM-dependent methyltransferase